MTQPIGSRDWLKPLPGGAQTLLHAVFNWQTLGTAYTSPYFDVTPFSGLYLNLSGFTGINDYTQVDVQFTDAAGAVTITTYTAIVNGLGVLSVNVPVLGAKARIVVTPPGIHNVTANFVVIGHGGGPSSAVRQAAARVAGPGSGALASGASIVTNVLNTFEGPAHATISAGASNGYLAVEALDIAGVAQLVALLTVGVNQSAIQQLWIPPQPVRVTVSNQGGVTGAFTSGVWLGRP